MTTPLYILGAYLVAINGVAFLLFALDKMKAGLRHRRIPERTLFVLATLGGSFGAIAGMNIFRHKTRKSSFQAIITLIVLVQLLLGFFIINILR